MYRLLVLAAVTAIFAPNALAQDAFVADARQYVEANADRFAAPSGAAATAVVTSAYTSPSTGLTHVYLRQAIGGVPLIRGGDITVTLRADRSVLHAAGSFLAEAADVQAMGPAMDAAAAASVAASHLGFTPTEPFEVLEAARGSMQETLLSEGGIAREPIEARLMYEPTEHDIRLVWDVWFYEPEDPHFWSIRVDAMTGEVVGQDDLVVHDHWGNAEGERVGFVRELSSPVLERELIDAPMSFAPVNRSTSSGAFMGGAYRVYAEPAESPNHTTGRTLVVNPADPYASPYGWHDVDGTPAPSYTTTRGNNVFAYADPGNQNQPNGPDAVPDGGAALLFDFPVDYSQQPAAYRLASVTNLFYWNNLMHDILHHVGFDEASGNFQVTNYTGQGLGNDPVHAEGQDGGGINNANMLTRPEGQPARMQMYLWNTTQPHTDGSFDNGIIAHEYAHGWSIRLTGGPNVVNCLQNRQQQGEGWSDYLSLITTMRPTDYAEQRRGIGTFALNQPVDGQGIRPAPYSTSMAENNFTFANLSGVSHPHGTGFIFATMLWEMTWNLIDAHGFDTDFHMGTGGNNMALRLISEAMKMQPCSPGFVDARDAILAADQAIYDGQNAIHIWTAFAKRGLGYSAVQGSPSAISGISEAFDLPPGMERSITLEVDQEPVPAGEFVNYTLTFKNGPAMNPLLGMDLTATLPQDLLLAPDHEGATYDPETGKLTLSSVDLDTNETLVWNFRGVADTEGGTQMFFQNTGLPGDDEFIIANGEGSANWYIIAGTQYTNSRAWMARNESTVTDQYLIIDDIQAEEGVTVKFRHRFDTEPQRDGGVVEISVAGGPWEDLSEHFLYGGYNSTIATSSSGNPLAGRAAFTGNSGALNWSEIDLSAFAGSQVQVRFRMGTNSSVGHPTYLGWILDRVTVADEVSLTTQVCAASGDIGLGCSTVSTLVEDPLSGAPVMSLEVDPIEIITGPGEVTTFSLPVTNIGDRALVLAAGPSGEIDWIQGSGELLTIVPDASGEATLTLDATNLDVGDYEGEILVVSNDPEATLVAIPFTAFVGTVSTNDDPTAMPDGYILEPIFPNPFRDQASVSLRVATGQDVQITLFDVMGREVMRVHDGELASGPAHSFSIDGAGLASGVYLLQARGEHFTTTVRITRVR